jgi:hypothetical protein
VLGALAVVCLALALAPAAAGAYHARPSALVAYYPSDRLPTIVDGLNAARFPAGAPVYFGNYSAQPRHGAATLETTPGPWEVAGERYRYMPILQFAESTLWDRRRVSAEEAAELEAAGDGELSGSMPPLAGVLAGSARERVRWGRELGRRFRAASASVSRGGSDRRLAVRRGPDGGRRPRRAPLPGLHPRHPRRAP